MRERLLVRAGTLLTPRSTFHQVTVAVREGVIEDLSPGDGPGD